MLLINKKLIGDVPDKPEEYQKGVEYLKRTYGKQIKFVRPGYPRKIKGIDSRGDETPNMKEPTPPMRIPLDAEVNTDRGMEFWSYTEGTPKLQPNNLYEPTGKRALQVTEDIVVSLESKPELAFFLYYKSPFLKGGMLKIDDPMAEAKERGDKIRNDIDLQFALYKGALADDAQLRVVAEGYGISKTDKKHPDATREELKGIVLKGELKKKSDPMSKGIQEFLSDVKVTDSIRLAHIIQRCGIDKDKIKWLPNGVYKIGERDLCKINVSDTSHRFEYLCNHLGNIANRPKLQDLLKDIVDKEYLEKLTDDKTFSWLARVSDLKADFKSKEEVRDLVFKHFLGE